jgi:Spy/CpxP family protein refolding chaperone
MNKKNLILSLVILIAAFLAGWVLYTYIPIFSEEKEQVSETEYLPNKPTEASPGAWNPGPGYRQMISLLEMSAEQASQFSQIEKNYRQKVSGLAQELDSIDNLILTEIQKKNPDEAKLDQLASRSGEIQYQLKKATTQHFLQIKNICHPKQVEKFNQVISEIDRYRKGLRRGPRDGRGMGPRDGTGRGRQERGCR